MKLPHPFYRLPLRFDPAQLAHEVSQFTESEWRPHPQGHEGNSALPLVAVNGDPTDESTKGPMRPTPYLDRCPYLRQVLAALEAPVGRTRLMRIEGLSEATMHVDANYYWSQRVRVHVPVLTYPGARYLCGDREVFMDAGDCWIVDTWRRHNALDPDERPRIHLVTDTVGSHRFWELAAQAERPDDPASGAAFSPRDVPYPPNRPAALETELCNFPVVMSPWEARSLVESITADLASSPDGATPQAREFRASLERFLQQWRGLWARFGEAPDGWPSYRAALQHLEAELARWKGDLTLPNGIDATSAIHHWIVLAALNPELAGPRGDGTGASAAVARSRTVAAPSETTSRAAAPFDRPVFLVAAPRSGSTLLFETLAQAAGVYTIGDESHATFEALPELAPAARGFASNRLTAADATPNIVRRLHQAFWSRLRDRDGRRPQDGSPVRMLEKTPKNALRIPFLAAAFPDARFIYLYREPRENLCSIVEAWRSGRFVTYPNLPDWDGPPWSLLLVPDWQALRGKGLGEIAAAQWETANRQILDDLAALPAGRWCATSYSRLLADPQAEVERLCHFAGFTWDRPLPNQLPLSRYTLTPPHPDKWKQNAALIEPLLPSLEQTAERARAVCARDLPADGIGRRPGVPANGNGRAGSGAALVQPEGRAAGDADAAPPSPSPLRSIHTTTFPLLLRELGISLFVSTYQSGRLVIFRADGEMLNTHFVGFNKPMGVAIEGNRLAVGTELEIREYRNVAAIAGKLEPPGKHDACFVPRAAHTTGDILIHELAYAGEELWFVNTRFSSLCTHHPDYSFVPHWRPRFVSALTPDDRCHLNGLAVVDGRPRYVTALAESDTPRGWRERKKDGGLVIDVESHEVLVRGLSMPHSPRWHQGQLWVLNSGEGGIGVVDLQSGRYREVARVPGFTRGLDFCGRYAFVGLSQVRESAVFSGIAIADLPLEQRTCGVWVLDLTTGRTVAFVKFEDAVQEIFAVQVARGLRYPDVVTGDKKIIANSFVLPDEALALVPVGFH